MEANNTAAIFYVTDKGLSLARKLAGLYPHAEISRFGRKSVAGAWSKNRNIIFIMAAGIAVRTIAPLIKDKRTDPAVIVLDERGKFAVSLLSGHLGGANERASEIAAYLNGEAVITTSSDLNNLTSVDLWAERNNLAVDNSELLPKIGTRLLNEGKLNVFMERKNKDIKLPREFIEVADPGSADIIISNRIITGNRSRLLLRPKNLVIGLGCNRGTSAYEIENAVKSILAERKFAFSSIHSVATIDIKLDEPGLLAFLKKVSLTINSFSPEELNAVAGIAKSKAAFRATGAYAVAEPAAILAAGSAKLLIPKQKKGNVTVAVAEKKIKGGSRKAEYGSRNKQKGRLYIVGTGPGNQEHITPHALKAIRSSEVIVGYGTYLDLIRELIRDKEVVSTGMTHEIDRCRKAVELALEGRTVAVISGGDPGIYAMAGLVFELLRAAERQRSSAEGQEATKKEENASAKLLPYCSTALSVEVIPGISAVNACAARLGAPLMHDFASISLSDRLTPWDLIEKRLEAAAKADFVIILYNPKSRGRVEHISRARDIILKHRKQETPVGIVKGAMRENERIVITDLAGMLDHDIDMQTTVIIGNSMTFVWENRMITPRGYKKKMRE